MEKINHNNAAKWVDRFLNGDTTCTQEQEIYAYFRHNNIPAELEKYREMFAWYANGMENKPNKKKAVSVRVLRYAAIAAAVTSIASIGIHYFKSHSSFQQEYVIYEGSYIIQDGKKITDINKILPELKHAEQVADEYDKAQSAMIDSHDEYMLQIVLKDISNPQTRQAIIQALSE